ncbi:MAG: exosortase C-terminal domain/associated protein EpsI [Armatimonadota bacterium]
MRPDERRYLVVLLLLAAGGVLCYRLRAASLPTSERASLLVLPEVVGDWEGTEVEVDKRAWEYLGAQDMVARSYDMEGVAVEVIGVAGNHWREVHSPANCFPSMGWHVLKEEKRVLPRVAGLDSPLPICYLVVTKGERREVAVYTFLLGGRATTSWWSQSGRMVWGRLWGRQQSGALLFLTASAGTDEAAVGERVCALAVQLCAEVADSLKGTG